MSKTNPFTTTSSGSGSMGSNRAGFSSISYHLNSSSTDSSSGSGSMGSGGSNSDTKQIEQNALPITIIKRMSDRIRTSIEQVMPLCDFIAIPHNNLLTNITATTTSNNLITPNTLNTASHFTQNKLQEELKQFLDDIKNQLDKIDTIRITYEKKMLPNEKLAIQLNAEWSALESTTQDKIKKLYTYASVLEPAFSDTQKNCLELILTTLKNAFQKDILQQTHKPNKSELLQQLAYTLFKHTLSTFPSSLYNAGPTCFISYSWSNVANIEQVHKIARDLKLAGIQVIIDIWNNTTGAIPAFTNHILTADYIIVVGTPDLVEKWNNFVSNGGSSGKTENNYQGNVVCAELNMILTRLLKKQNNNHGIINLLLQGKHESSFPNQLISLPSSDTDFTNKSQYIDALFNLLSRLIPKNSDTKLSIENHIAIIEKERKEIRNQLKLMQSWDETKLLSHYQEISDSEEISSAIESHLVNKLKSIKESQVSSHAMTTNATTATQPILWNIPSQHHLFIGRETLLEELHQELGIQPKTAAQTDAKFKLKALAIAAFSGLGGIGKTQLALKYIRDTTHPYTLKAWFQAEKIEELKQSLIEFAKSRGYSDEKVTFETAFLYLKQWLTKNPDWLIVYDNVNSYEEIEPFLPDSGGSIILTSRNHEWPNGFKKLDIKVMTEEEAIKMIQSIIKRDKELTETKKLAKILGYLPLAMAQASAYIEKKHKSISDYLKLYEIQQLKLLADKTIPKGTNHLSVATTWNITLEILPKEARELLTVCAYLAPEKIPKALLLTWLKKAHPEIKEPEDVIDDYLSPLEQYSFIEYDEDKYVRVHRLVQAILRNQHQASGQQGLLKWYNVLLNAADNEFWQYTQILENIARKNELMPHLYALVEHFEKKWPNNPSFEFAKLLNCIGFTLLSFSANYGGALTYCEKCLKICRTIAGVKLTFIATVLHNLGIAYGNLGNYQKLKELLEQALTIKERNFGKEHVELANTLQSLGVAYGKLGNYQKLKELLEQALNIKERNFGKEHVELASTLHNLGVAYGKLGNTQKEIELLEQALNIKERNFGKEHVELANTLRSLGVAYGYFGNYQKQKELLEQALTIQERNFGKEHVELANTLGSLGNAYGKLGNTQKQKELLEQALNIKERNFGKEHVELANTLHNLGVAYGNLGNYQKQKELLEQALTIQERNFGKEHVQLAYTLHSLGVAYGYLGNAQKEIELLEKALVIYDKHYANEQPPMSMGIALWNLALTYQKCSEIEKAYRTAERCMAVYKNIWGEQHSKTEGARNLLKQCEKAWLELEEW